MHKASRFSDSHRGWVAVCLLSAAYFVPGLSLAAGASKRSSQEAEMSSRKVTRQPGPTDVRLYSFLETRHHLNTYFDRFGLVERQYPSLHVRFQAGGTFYGGKVDIYGTVGIIKLPNTQQVLQRRPELAVDYYILRRHGLDLRFYNITMLPFRKLADDAYYSSDMHHHDIGDYQSVVQSDGAVHTLGLGTTAKSVLWQGAGHRLESRVGLNVWTHLYSREREIETPDVPNAGFEDRVMRLGSKQSMGFGWMIPADGLQLYVDGYFRSFFYPKYVDTLNAADQQYKVRRSSHYRLRVKYRLTERVFLANDFFHFFNGLFESKAYGPQRRFRNIARVVCSL